jgi:hypothetical protein
MWKLLLWVRTSRRPYTFIIHGDVGFFKDTQLLALLVEE